MSLCVCVYCACDCRPGDVPDRRLAAVWYRTLNDDDLVSMASEPASVRPPGSAPADGTALRSNFVETWLWTDLAAG